MIPVNKRLAEAMVAARAGWVLPQRRGPGATGELFMQRMQAAIAERLHPDRLARYVSVRDAVRSAVRELNAGDSVAAGKNWKPAPLGCRNSPTTPK